MTVSSLPLLIAGNRRVEPWASSALANLNHRLREQESVAYIRPALEAMPEVQRTGDIFSPPLGFAPCFPPIHRRKLGKKLMRFYRDPDFPLMLPTRLSSKRVICIKVNHYI